MVSLGWRLGLPPICLASMRVWLVIAGILASLALAEPARATPGLPGPPAVASDTERAPRVQRERATGPARGSPARGGFELVERCAGFAATTLAAAGSRAAISPHLVRRSGKVRVALLIERFGPGIGGVENVAWRVAEGLARAGDEVHVVARRAAPCPGVVLHPVSVPEFWQPLRVCAFSRAAARAAPRGEYDVVYSLARTVHQDLYRAGAGSHLDYLRRRYRFPARQMRRLSPRHAVLADFERRVFGDPSQRIVCNSEMVRGEIERRYRVAPSRLRVIRNGVALERFALSGRERARLRAELASGDDVVFLLAGSGFARKGLDTALRALARARIRAQLGWPGAGEHGRGGPAQALGVEGARARPRFRPICPRSARGRRAAAPTRTDAFANVGRLRRRLPV